MQKSVLLSLVISLGALTGCGGDAAPARSADDVDAGQHAAERADDAAQKAEDKADKAADRADAAADDAQKANDK